MVPPDDGSSDAAAHRSSDRQAGATGEWFAASALRVALAIVGLVVVLFALGQAAGVDVLGMIGEALSTQVGRWLLVALFGLLLIAVAIRGFGLYRR